MVAKRWNGGAARVAQSVTATPTNVEIGDQFLLSMNGKSVRYTAATASVADVTAGLTSAWEDSTLPEFLEVTATDDTTTVTLTAKSAGVPFVVTGSTINGGSVDSQTLDVVMTEASEGPHHWGSPNNWAPVGVPVDGDSVYLENSDVSITYELDQASVSLVRLSIAASFTGEVGLARINESGTLPYVEFRERTLQIQSDLVDIGQGLGPCAGRIQLDSGSQDVDITVYRTGIAPSNDEQAFQWKGTGSGSTLAVYDGSVGVAVHGGEQASLAVLRVSGGHVCCGEGVTHDTLERSGEGQLVTAASFTSVNQTGGETSILGEAAVATLNLDGGRIDFRSNGTINHATLDGSNALLDFSGDLRSRTVNDLTLLRGTVIDPHQTVIWSNGVQIVTGVHAP